jgi:hypothetical protein
MHTSQTLLPHVPFAAKVMLERRKLPLVALTSGASRRATSANERTEVGRTTKLTVTEEDWRRERRRGVEGEGDGNVKETSLTCR